MSATPIQPKCGFSTPDEFGHKRCRLLAAHTGPHVTYDLDCYDQAGQLLACSCFIACKGSCQHVLPNWHVHAPGQCAAHPEAVCA